MAGERTESRLRGTKRRSWVGLSKFAENLSNIWVFDGFDKDTVQAAAAALFNQSTHTYFDKETVIAEPSDVVTSALLVHANRIRLYGDDDSVLLRVVGEGEVCCVTTALIGSQVGVTVRTDEMTELSEIPIAQLRMLAEPNPRFLTNCVTHLRDIIGNMNGRVGSRDIRDCVWDAIRTNTTTRLNSKKSPPASQRVCMFSRGDLVEYVSLSVKTVDKYLKILEAERLIRLDGEYIVVLDPPAPAKPAYSPYDS